MPNIFDFLAQGTAPLRPTQIDPSLFNRPPVIRPQTDLGVRPIEPTQLDNNFLASLAQAPQIEAAPSRAPRERKSLLDIIGGIADTVATVGGADPLYSMNRDAATERQRQVDLDEMRRQQHEMGQRLGGQQYQIGEQGLQAGALDIQNDERTRIGETLASVAGSKDPAALWGQIAQQTGLPPDKAAAIGAALQQGVDPARLAQSFGYAPKAQGSLSKEIQIYKMLKSENPDLAPAYLQSLTQPDSMSPYQQAQLQIGLAGLGLRQDQFAENQYQFDTKQAGGGSAGSNQDVKNILIDNGITLDSENDLVADLIRNSTNGWVERGLSMIPGVFGNSTIGQQNIGRLETIDNAIVLALAGGKLGAGVSNADRDFFKDMSGKISDPTIPIETRLESWDQVKARLRGILARSSKPNASLPHRGTPRPSAAPIQDTPAMAEARRRGLL